MSIKYITSCHSIIGVKESEGKENEDSFFLLQKKISGEDVATFAGVADGMGGLAYGKEASSFVKESLCRWFEDEFDSLKDLSKKEFASRLLDEIRNVHYNLSEKIENEWGGMQSGSTLCLVYIRGNSYIAVNIGDSRAYLLQGSEIIQVTCDQTLAQYKIDSGELLEEEIDPTDRRLHTLLQAIGASDEVAPDFYFGKLAGSFMFFLCSDGMINRVKIDEIKDNLRSTIAKSEKEKIVNLMKLAIKRGEMDNLTGLIIKKCDTKSIEDAPKKISPPVKVTVRKESEQETGRL